MGLQSPVGQKTAQLHPAMADAPRGRGRGRPPSRSHGTPKSATVARSEKLPKIQRKRKQRSAQHMREKLAVGLDVSDSECEDGEGAEGSDHRHYQHINIMKT